MFEGFQFLEPPHVRFFGLDGSRFRRVITDRVIDFLLGHSVRFDQVLVARRSNSGKIGVGLGGVQIRSRLRKLLIDFGRVNIREQLALWHARSDIVVPLLQIAVGARIDGRFHIGLHDCRAARGLPGQPRTWDE